MITLNQITLQRGTKVLLENTTATIYAKEKIGLVGRNGSGKSSLFSLLLNDLSTESGDVFIQSDAVIKHLSQSIPNSKLSAIDFVIQGDQEIYDVLHELKIAEENHQAEKIGGLHNKLYELNGYDAKARAGIILNGLGFKPDEHERIVSEFSGGWRMRLSLAKVLMCPSDILLLDEPTNHLDLDAIIWLESWLKKYSGILILISHDREFLDNVVNRIIHIENLKLNCYSGNYSEFEKLRILKLSQQQSLYEKQQKLVAHTMSFVNRFRAKATKAKQAQSRLKSLNRLELISQAHVDSPFSFSFKETKPCGAPLIRLENVATGYGRTIILNKINISLNPGDRIGLLGHNGAGKSTLIKTLSNELPIINGVIQDNKNLSIGYFAQHQIDQLHLNESPIWHLEQIDKKTTIQQFRNFLGGFDFYGDMAMHPIKNFSGGEKARLVLALLVWQSPNLLLLDEPTNHLDMDMRDALTLALQNYAGAVVLVSHDRHLLQTTVDQFWLVHKNRVSCFDDDLDAYAKWVLDPKDDPNKKTKEKKGKQQKNITETIELKLEKLNKKLQAIDHELSDQTIYEESHFAELQKLLDNRKEIQTEIEKNESLWLEIHDDL